MKFATPTNKLPMGDGRLPIERPATARHKTIGNRPSAIGNSAFTLAEVLAALMFMAIVIPVAVEALHVSSLAGEVAARKGAAVRVADRILNENIVTTNWNHGTQNGTVTEGALDFRWTLSSETWPQDAMQLVTAEVKFSARGKDYSVKLSTLANAQTRNSQVALQP